MKIIKDFRLLLIFLSFFACDYQKDPSGLYGSWKVYEWKKMDSGENINNPLTFNFDSLGRYMVDYGSEKERGEYWLAGEFLHTVEDGRAEKKVKVLQLSKDTFIMEMNRSGYIERVGMKREQ